MSFYRIHYFCSSLLCYTMFRTFALMAVLHIGSNAEIRANFPKLETPCKFKIEPQRLHNVNVTAIVKVVNQADCIGVCLHHQQCVSVSIVRLQVQRKILCLLSSTTAKKYQLQPFEHGIYLDLTCTKSRIPIRSGVRRNSRMYDSCGLAVNLRKVRINRPIMSGRFPTEPYSQPWQGQVVKQKRNICGIILISKNIGDSSTSFAVGATHCFLNRGSELNQKIKIDEFGFLFGVHDLQVHTPHIAYRTATSIFPHPDYAPNGRNDIALIKLRNRLQFSDYIRPICLPDGKISYSGLKCIICGYDHEEEPHLPTPTCLSLIGLKPIKPTEILAMTTGSLDTNGIRAGDSGSSLSCSKQGRQFVIGIISSMIRVQSKGVTLGSIYTNVGHYEKWLKNTISNGTTAAQTAVGNKFSSILDLSREFRKL